MTEKTKGQIESQISEAIIKFEKDYMGRGPTETKTYYYKRYDLSPAKRGSYTRRRAISQNYRWGRANKKNSGSTT